MQTFKIQDSISVSKHVEQRKLLLGIKMVKSSLVNNVCCFLKVKVHIL